VREARRVGAAQRGGNYTDKGCVGNWFWQMRERYS